MMRDKQKGAALIVVLSFLVLVGIITATIVTISQKSSRKIKVETDRSLSSYLAEGAVARLQWLIMNDIQSNPNRSSANLLDNSSQTSKYLAVGKQISIRYYDATVTARIFDMASGLNIAGSYGFQSLRSLLQAYSMNPTMASNLNIFIDRITDYVNPGSGGKSPNGMDKSDYANLGLYPLPRSDQMEYRDEVLWIPDSGYLFTPNQYGRLSIFNIIPPQGMYFNVYQTNFFSADKAIIMALCGFTEDEANTIVQGRDEWLNNNDNLPISNFINSNYMITLTQRLSFQDSGFYTLVVNASQGQGEYERTITVSTAINTMGTDNVQYYEYLLY